MTNGNRKGKKGELEVARLCKAEGYDGVRPERDGLDGYHEGRRLVPALS